MVCSLMVCPSQQELAANAPRIAGSDSTRARALVKLRRGRGLLASLQGVHEGPRGAHHLPAIPDACALRRLKARSGCSGCFLQLFDPGRPCTQRPFARHAVDDRRQTQGALVISACGGDQCQTSDAPYGSKRIVQLVVDGQRFLPGRGCTIEIAQPEQRVGETLEKTSRTRFVVL